MQQRGFTLIELIIVIVILGILAVTAAPRFLDIEEDARAGTVDAVEGALNSAISVVYGKSLIQGQTGATGSIQVNDAAMDVVFGYPQDDVDFLLTLLQVDPGMDPSYQNATATGEAGVSSILFYGYDDSGFNYAAPAAGTGCLLLYTEAANANTPATVEAFTGEC